MDTEDVFFRMIQMNCGSVIAVSSQFSSPIFAAMNTWKAMDLIEQSITGATISLNFIEAGHTFVYLSNIVAVD